MLLLTPLSLFDKIIIRFIYFIIFIKEKGIIRMKKFTQILLFSLALSVNYSFASTVYINGKQLDQKIIDQTINQFKKSSPMAASQMNNPQFKQQILQSIAMQQVILMEGNKNNLDKTSAYQEKLQEVKPMIYAQILQENASAKITDADVLAKYKQMQVANVNQKQYEVSHILVKDEKTANEILAKLKTGAKFAELAKKYSLDTGSKVKGGDLGWSDGNNYVPEFTKAIKSLQKGQYTLVAVKSQFGYHIIKLNDVKPAEPLKLFDVMKVQLKQDLQMEKTRTFFEDLKNKYKIEVK